MPRDGALAWTKVPRGRAEESTSAAPVSIAHALEWHVQRWNLVQAGGPLLRLRAGHVPRPEKQNVVFVRSANDIRGQFSAFDA
ncbi:MAG TPA: hypothetical protein VHP11_12870, partial [Tepidisphaeraceae bacterium]|nr:hypothetical protein [Tepidisphaeraceae bacterium]